jgi:hypothetical protein
MEENKIVIYKDKNNSIQLEVKLDGDMVWPSRNCIR